MGIFSWIVLGLIVGALAKWIMPGKDPGGFIVTTILGIAGALIGGYLASLLGFGTVTGFSLKSLGISVIGALLLLFIYRQFKGGSASDEAE